jgi:hypothetical protein
VCRCTPILLTLCLDLASYSWCNHRTDHTEISVSIVDMCVPIHCIATIATLLFASWRIHWCALCCSARPINTGTSIVALQSRCLAMLCHPRYNIFVVYICRLKMSDRTKYIIFLM